MAQFFVSRNGKVVFSDKKEFDRMNNIPYGLWTCGDGRKVLFNRFYEPIFERLPKRPVTDADPAEWVDFIEQEWFYGDEDPESKRRKKSMAALVKFMKGQEFV